jgi:hypothetical protein
MRAVLYLEGAVIVAGGGKVLHTPGKPSSIKWVNMHISKDNAKKTAESGTPTWYDIRYY